MIEIDLRPLSRCPSEQVFELTFFLEKWDEQGVLRIQAHSDQVVLLSSRFCRGVRGYRPGAEVWEVRLGQCSFMTVEEVADVEA